MLYIRLLNHIHFITESLCPFSKLYLFYPLIPGNHYSTLNFYEFDYFLDSSYKWDMQYFSFSIGLFHAA